VFLLTFYTISYKLSVGISELMQYYTGYTGVYLLKKYYIPSFVSF